MYRHFFKRLLDIVLSFCGLIVLSPIFLGLIIAVKLDDPGPAFLHRKGLVFIKRPLVYINFAV